MYTCCHIFPTNRPSGSILFKRHLGELRRQVVNVSSSFEGISSWESLPQPTVGVLRLFFALSLSSNLFSTGSSSGGLNFPPPPKAVGTHRPAGLGRPPHSRPVLESLRMALGIFQGRSHGIEFVIFKEVVLCWKHVAVKYAICLCVCVEKHTCYYPWSGTGISQGRSHGIEFVIFREVVFCWKHVAFKYALCVCVCLNTSVTAKMSVSTVESLHG
jgi:hypothetical protein